MRERTMNEKYISYQIYTIDVTEINIQNDKIEMQ